MSPPRRAVLDLGPALPGQDKHWRLNLSAVAADGATLYVADDEHPSLCRLRRTAADRWEPDGIIRLAETVADLPGGPEGETDIEGLDLHGGRLWLVGSHSLARRKPRKKDGDAERLARLREIRDDPNRHLLGRIDLATGTTALLPMREGEGRLLDHVRGDPWLGPFVGIPAKENGFDIEGLAVAPDDRVFLGLRGPVLRGWAVVLDLDLRETAAGGLQLQPDMPGYRRHFIDLRGLGVRDLVWDGDDLLILAGPTMDLDGPVRVLRWRRAADAAADSVLPANQIEPVLEVPFGDGSDHAEGIAFVGPRELLVLYDSPADWRLAEGDSRIVADLFDIAP